MSGLIYDIQNMRLNDIEKGPLTECNSYKGDGESVRHGRLVIAADEASDRLDLTAKSYVNVQGFKFIPSLRSIHRDPSRTYNELK